VAELCKAAMDFLDCQAFLSYLFDEREGRLRLNAYAGIPDNEARRIEWLDLGQAICGCAAKDRKRIIAENISQTNHTRTELIKSLGIKAHCCHPLIVQGRLIGTLSFGSNSRLVFSAIEIEVMKGMADLIAIAMHRIKVEQSLHENEERLRLAAQTARFGIHDYDAAAERTLWSPELYAIAGLVPGTEVNNDVMMSTVHPADRPKVRDAIRAALSPAGGGIFDQEFRIVRQDTGETRWVQNRCQTLFRDSPEGRRIIRNVGVAVDITERKKREEQLQLLMREVNHRAKNLLAVVQSIACQTAKSGAGGDFAAIFQERLAGLAASQELLVASEWKGISLEDLIHAQLSHFGAPKDQRLFLHGPALAVSPPAAQTLGMAFHELGTNAIKYGALSNESGTVRIDWDVTRAPESRFRLTWIERGGPPAVPPGRRGFGTTVLTEMAELGLDGEIVLEFPPGGLIWQVTAPAALVLDAREQPALEARPS
ncbi:MAG: GAF domain-containing protein, partial [Methylocapsa sp.]|nr:GAF domain-containing protein [Methylocapsa sp.]